MTATLDTCFTRRLQDWPRSPSSSKQFSRDPRSRNQMISPAAFSAASSWGFVWVSVFHPKRSTADARLSPHLLLPIHQENGLRPGEIPVGHRPLALTPDVSGGVSTVSQWNRRAGSIKQKPSIFKTYQDLLTQKFSKGTPKSYLSSGRGLLLSPNEPLTPTRPCSRPRAQSKASTKQRQSPFLGCRKPPRGSNKRFMRPSRQTS